MQATVTDRLWSQVERGPGCWLWTGRTLVRGYGRIWVNGKQCLAHRVALALSEGLDPATVPPETLALHSCDTPLCCNPSHLRWGTSGDNARDREDRGRHHDVSGEQNPRARLSAQDVLAIRQRLAEGARQVDLASEYGVSRQAIWKIGHNKKWTGR